ncbi:MAG: S24 family peptidase [Chloroherpetonaceae bacterium]|nr:hypothetical protein [Chloroherpetonaceae bacterium]MDW8020213.1 S24 family peptidase [Chloroherpetonaceae bacterium]
MEKLATLTEAQNRCFNFLVRYVAEHRRAPSIREIGAALGYASTNAVSQTLEALAAKGYIRRRKGARQIEILYRDEFSPLNQTGSPVPAQAVPVMKLDTSQRRLQLVPRGVLHLDAAQLGKGEFCICLNDDDGMDKAGIFKGDWIVLHRRPILESERGVLVGVADGDTFIVRRHYVTNGRIQLVAANRSYTERFIKPQDPSSMQVLGAVKMVIRKIQPLQTLPNAS